MAGSFFLQSLIPAAQALATRGLINIVLREIKVRGAGLRPILPWLLFAFAAAAADGLNRLAQDFAMRRLEDDLNLELNTMILSHAAQLDLGFFEDPNSQNILYRAKQNPARNLTRFLGGTLGVLSNLIQMVSLLAIVVAIEPLVIIVLAPAAIPYLWLQSGLSSVRYRLERSRAAKRRWTQYFVSRLTQAPSVPEVRILDLAPLLIRKFRTLMAEFRDQDHRLLRRSTRAAAMFSGLATVALYALLARVALRVMRGSSTMGDLAVFGAATARLRSILEAEINTLAGVLEETLNVSDLQELLKTKPVIGATRTAATNGSYCGEIELHGVSFAYPGSSEPVLRDISFAVRAGETVALVGENGSGKSTLVKLIVRFYDPTAGRILLDGRDLKDLAPRDLHSQISFVFQEFGHYEGTVADNIGYGDWRRLGGDRAAIERAAARAGVADMIRRLPDGFDTTLGRNFGEFDLSIGQRQRIAVTRAFARPASLVVLDEPSSNLDPLAERELFLRCHDLARGCTTILISHRFSTIRMADRIIVLERGKIVEIGSHDDLVRRGGCYARLYESASRSEPPACAVSS